MHVPLFTLCLQFALHILRPRPRRYAGLRDKSHTQKGREREKDRGGGWQGKDTKKREGGGEGGLTLFTAMQLWSAFEPGGVLWQPPSLSLSLSVALCTLAAKLIAIATAISTVHDINMVACRRQREAFKGT